MQNKKRSILLIIAIVVVAIIIGCVFYFNNHPTNKVVIKIDGSVYGTYDLNKDQTIDVLNGENLNIVKITDGQVDVVYSNCANQVCVETYPMSKDYPYAIVCIPHGMVIEFEEE